MASKKVGTLIKEARTNAGLTQAQLAKKVDGVSAQDISKAERGELQLSNTALKQIAKATGVTQSSLLNASSSSSSSSSKKKTSSSKTSSSKKKSSSKTSSSGTSVKLTATEKKLVTLYRDADSDTKKAAMKLLKGEESSVIEILTQLLKKSGVLSNLTGSSSSSSSSSSSDMIGDVVSTLFSALKK